jgi:hypothetical protein
MNSRQTVGSSPRSIRLSISAWTFRSPPRPGRAYCVAVDAEGADQYRSVAQYARMPSTGQPPGRQRHEPARARRFRDAVPAMIGRSPSGSRTALLSLRADTLDFRVGIAPARRRLTLTDFDFVMKY